MDIDKYLIPLENIDLTKILSTWTWLTDNKSIVALTKSGDALLKDDNSYLYFLDVGNGVIEFIANNFCDFFDKKLSDELIEELLFTTIVDKLEQCGIILKSGQIYSYTLLPLIGGKYDENNMYALNIYEHFNLTGDIHFQLKDLPDGTKVVMKVVE